MHPTTYADTHCGCNSNASSSKEKYRKLNAKNDALCAFVNDPENDVLRRLMDHLGCPSEGDSTFKPDEEEMTKAIRQYNIKLNTKYYWADVSIWSFDTFETFNEALKSGKLNDKKQVYALMICANRLEVSTDFLARITQLSNTLCSVESKALILKDGIELKGVCGADDAKIYDKKIVNDSNLSEFAVMRGIELISIASTNENLNDSLDLCDEEGAIGIARVLELLETIKWPDLQMKPNPIGCRADQRQRLLDCIEEITECCGQQQKMPAGLDLTVDMCTGPAETTKTRQSQHETYSDSNEILMESRKNYIFKQTRPLDHSNKDHKNL